VLRELRLEVNKRCNFACLHCYTDKYTFDEVAIDKFYGLMDTLAGQGLTDVSMTGGEPLMDLDRVLSLTEHARSLGLTVRINTNGVLLRPKVCDRLMEAGVHEFQVSLNSYDADDFNEFVQSEHAFGHVVDGIKYLADKGAHVTIRFTLMERTAPNLAGTFKLCESLGVKSFKVRTLVQAAEIEEELAPSLVETLRKHSEEFFEVIKGSKVQVRFSDNGLGFEVPTTDNCKFLSCLCGTDAIFVTADGNIAPCPFLRDEKSWWLGNIKSDDFVEVMSSSSRLAEFIGDKHGEEEGCGNSCTNGCKAANYYLTGDPDHIFLPDAVPAAHAH
jgi:radical SAM protein with 4Fe4S-binding SPASM domain